jgi:flagellar biogenesis protein FliO
MDALFGNMETITKFFVAFVVALGLMALSFWLFRRLTGQRLGGGATRGRQPRLAVIDAAVVDARRRLVLVRRDNVEHLLMIGGPSDVVIEQNIVRAVPIAASRELSSAARNAAGAEAPPRGPEIGMPRADTGPSWPLQPEAPRAEPEPPAIRPRPPRLTEPDAMPRAPRVTEPDAMPRAPRLAEPEAMGPRAEPAMPRAAAAGEPPSRPERPPFRSSPPMPGARPEPPLRTVEPRAAPATADVNLADMAQRLEAALRRPATAAEPRGPEPRSAEPPPRPAPAPEPPVAREPARPEPPRAAPPERPRPAEAEVKTEPKPEPKPDARPASPKSVLDSLEQEMASLLGRPSGKE